MALLKFITDVFNIVIYEARYVNNSTLPKNLYRADNFNDENKLIVLKLKVPLAIFTFRSLLFELLNYYYMKV